MTEEMTSIKSEGACGIVIYTYSIIATCEFESISFTKLMPLSKNENYNKY